MVASPAPHAWTICEWQSADEAGCPHALGRRVPQGAEHGPSCSPLPGLASPRAAARILRRTCQAASARCRSWAVARRGRGWGRAAPGDTGWARRPVHPDPELAEKHRSPRTPRPGPRGCARARPWPLLPPLCPQTMLCFRLPEGISAQWACAGRVAWPHPDSGLGGKLISHGDAASRIHRHKGWAQEWPLSRTRRLPPRSQCWALGWGFCSLARDWPVQGAHPIGPRVSISHTRRRGTPPRDSCCPELPWGLTTGGG